MPITSELEKSRQALLELESQLSELKEFAAKEKLAKVNKSMNKKEIVTDVIHKVPADLRRALTSDPDMLAKWNDLTPLARNEWICWITYVKTPETRRHHIERACTELIEGKRRPCCWPGCPHRRPSAKKWF